MCARLCSPAARRDARAERGTQGRTLVGAARCSRGTDPYGLIEPERHHPCASRVVIFGKQAEPAARHLGRGSAVFVAGHLRQRERVTQEGQKLRSLEVVAERVEFLSEPAGHIREIARTFIDPPAMLPEADAPAQWPESDPPAPEE